MSSIKFTVVLFAIAFSFIVRGEQPAPDLAKENAELKAQVEKLKNQIIQLKMDLMVSEASRKNAENTPRLSYTVPVPTTQPSILTLPLRPKMPPGAIEHQFNGDVYYVIPVASGISADSARGNAPATIKK